ncbi:unnamed protein product [Soboliphyme baturini]|uniref:Large ribosomal subunit protein mL49 n=1 Tax=Soboliphyme baturini TaxID=241478 RepID=A0A183IT46_9BILA|nr:unnamed protein product [Soboliphyme baturini]
MSELTRLCTTGSDAAAPGTEATASRNVSSLPEKIGAAENTSYPPPWENPWLYALGPPKPPPKYTEVVESKEEFRWVERLYPISVIPPVPQHKVYPTPSGWVPPKDPPPDLPYLVRRTRFHTFPVYLETRRDMLDFETMEFNYVELVILKRIEGDVFACEKDLATFLQAKLGHPVGTHVNEAQGKIRVKGADRSLVEQFLIASGF